MTLGSNKYYTSSNVDSFEWIDFITYNKGSHLNNKLLIHLIVASKQTIHQNPIQGSKEVDLMPLIL